MLEAPFWWAPCLTIFDPWSNPCPFFYLKCKHLTSSPHLTFVWIYSIGVGAGHTWTNYNNVFVHCMSQLFVINLFWMIACVKICIFQYLYLFGIHSFDSKTKAEHFQWAFHIIYCQFCSNFISEPLLFLSKQNVCACCWFI